jgi:hypothetical protein
MNILKLIVHGLAIAFVTNLTTKVSTQEIIILGFIAAVTMFLLDKYITPKINIEGIDESQNPDNIENIENNMEEQIDTSAIDNDIPNTIEQSETTEIENTVDTVKQEIVERADEIIPVEGKIQEVEQTGPEFIEEQEQDAELKQINCEELGQVIDKETGKCVAVIKKNGETTKVKESQPDETKPKVYIVKCKNGPNTCVWNDADENKEAHETYGYNFIPPTEWHLPQKRPPVCLPQQECPVCPVYTNNNPIDLLQVKKQD